ncbi:rab-GTPase-TBC domain-containing protein [Pyronema omphalodes]|nr:rab-GTPase-TBC domain-containing protein [Pyronema omphalodes]
MRTIIDARNRWNNIFEDHRSIESLKDVSCDDTLRSVLWRIFLLYPDADITPSTWISRLQTERTAYAELRRHHLGDTDFEAEELDPLAEDESNPYHRHQRDLELRAEIVQDIERCMPENTFFREPSVQEDLTEILFVYCKLNRDVSYRQGFHEIAAVVYWVVVCDALADNANGLGESPYAGEGRVGPYVTTTAVTNGDIGNKVLNGTQDGYESFEDPEDTVMKEVLDRRYINHDAFSLFQSIMRNAKAWYEVSEDGGKGGVGTIVKKSQYVHETVLVAVDPELAAHLTELDVLPQVFLIRWIRLLFCREFPFDQLLHVWDKIFSEDPDLQLVDLICASMLLRIRWQLIEADYSTAMQLLLRYPSPPVPVSLIEDALYLRSNLNPSGGKYIIIKHSSRAPAPYQKKLPPQKPERRPLSPTMNSLFQPGQIETIIQDAARNMIDRSEKWGVNRAVREAVVEVKKGIQGQQRIAQIPRRGTPGSPMLKELEKKNKDLQTKLIEGGERRRRLARILQDSISLLDNEDPAVEDSQNAAWRIKIKHVQECLLDDSMPINQDITSIDSTPFNTPPASTISTPRISAIGTPKLVPFSSSSSLAGALSTPKSLSGQPPPAAVEVAKSSESTKSTPPPPPPPASPPAGFVKTGFRNNTDLEFLGAPKPRTSLAQSSFAWMLGDETVSKYRSEFVAGEKKGLFGEKEEDDGVKEEVRDGDTGIDMGVMK